jgi:hypothetical protein
MKVIINKYLTMKFIFLILGFCLFFLLGCNYINEPTAIPPSAQITNIYDITDTSAQVDVQISGNTNAQSGYLYLNVYKNNVMIISSPAYSTPLSASYSFSISKLNEQTEYSLQLYFSGIFGGGTSYEQDFNIGSPKSFTTK